MLNINLINELKEIGKKLAIEEIEKAEREYKMIGRLASTKINIENFFELYPDLTETFKKYGEDFESYDLGENDYILEGAEEEFEKRGYINEPFANYYKKITD